MRMQFLRPLLAKIELICQQLAMPQLSGVSWVGKSASPGVQDRMAGGSRVGLAMRMVYYGM